MKLVALKDAYKVQALTKGLSAIKTFRFDSLSDANEPNLEKRIFLMNPPNSVRLTEDASNEDENVYAISFFLFDLIGDTEGEGMADLWESIEDDVTAINKGIVNDNTDIIEITSNIEMDRGHHEHNADLIGIWCRYSLRVFDCLNP